MIELRPVESTQIELLTQMSKGAFASDIDVGAPDAAGGPEGFDSVAWHRKMSRVAEKFFSIYNDGVLVGGMLIFRQREKAAQVYNLGRIWLDPAVHRKGVGLASIDAMLRAFPAAKLWTLETPVWNTRTRDFYLKAGFNIVEEGAEEIFFEMKISD